jgi:hypothetical protein
VFNKNLVFVKHIELEQEFICHGFFVRFDSNIIAMWSEQADYFWVININTNDRQKIDLSSSGYVSGESFSGCYYWTNELFVIIDHVGNEYRIDVISGSVNQLTYDELKWLSPSFREYVDISAKFIEVKNYIPQQLQFTYYDQQNSEIGFADCSNYRLYTQPYASDDVHEVFFVWGNFIVTGCYGIVHVGDEQTTLVVPRYGQEFRGSILMMKRHEILTFERYWKGIDNRMFLRLLKLSDSE